MLMVYLPQEKLLSEADAYIPPLRNATPPTPPVSPNPFTVNLVDNITRLGLAVGNVAPLHGHLVPFADLNLAIGKSP